MLKGLKTEGGDGISIELIQDKKNWQTLSKELKVAVVIQKLNDLKDPSDLPYFSNIGKHLSKIDDMSKTTIHNALDHLIDLGTIDAEWTQVDTRWVRRFRVTGESREFIKLLAREL
jgi:hypothetical protein